MEKRELVVPRRCFFCGFFLLFSVFALRVCLSYCAVLSVPGLSVVNYWERADPLALLYVIFSCAFVTFPFGVLG